MTDLLTQLCAELATLVERQRITDDAFGALDNLHDAARDQIRDLETELEQAQADIAHRDQRLLEAWEWTSTGTPGCETRSLAEQMETDLRGIFAALGEDYTPDQDPAERITEALEQMPTALDALRRYLTRQGLPADPIRLDDPDLWALYEALAPG